MTDPSAIEFDVQSFLNTPGIGRKIVHVKTKQTFFSQGNPADSVFYLQHGRARGSGANIEVCRLRRLERQWFMQQGPHSRSQAQLGL